VKPTLCLLALLVFASTFASAETFGNWEAGISDDGTTLYAFTANDSGSLFGEWCTVRQGSASG
jgi:hypothetical protein